MTADGRRAGLLLAMPLVFVLIWSTGFIVARYGMPHAPPLGFLSWRYALSVLVFLVWIRLSGEAWPSDRRQWLHLGVVGLGMHAGYLGGVWAAVKGGMGAGTAALIVGLQPVLTALAAGPLLGERLMARQWLGIALGFGGVVLVVAGNWGGMAGDAQGYLWGLFALAGITAGTLYQKRHCGPIPMLTGGVIQYSAAGLVTFALALATETMDVQWTPQFAFALGWLVLVLSLGAIGLLYTMIRHGEASRVSSLFFLTPPVTAVMAFLLFGERLPLLALAGLAVSATGVALVSRGDRMSRP
jgi:drug/metabolite transporter (DMT)-like permease